MTDDLLSTTFAALADPTRRALLARLATGEATVNELAEPFDISLQAVSRHLKVLEHAGLISRASRAQFRPCRFEAAPLDTAVGWIEQYRHLWQERFDALEQHLREIQQARPDSGPPPPTRRTTGTGSARPPSTTSQRPPKEQAP